MPSYTATELTDPPMSTAVSMEDGSAEATYRIEPVNDGDFVEPQHVQWLIDKFLGGVLNLKTNVISPGTADAGKVVRVLPVVHPFRPELSVSGITLMGSGRWDSTDSQDVGLEAVTTAYPKWRAVDFKARFVKRPYFLVDNSEIAVKQDLIYWPPDGTSGIPIRYAEEWKRFTEFKRAPTNETVSAEHGTVTFRTQSGSEPNGFSYTGQPDLFLQNELIEFDWYQVPYRYFFQYETHRPYLSRFLGHVNQHDWFGFPKGSLLYLGATPTKIYSPVTPDPNLYQAKLQTGVESGLLCNVRMRFVYTAREGTDVPNDSHALLTNKNHVAAGHNLLPQFGDRTFRYAVGSGATDADKKPTFPSFPVQLLWTDPLLMQQGGAL